jgi:hypothetical protein
MTRVVDHVFAGIGCDITKERGVYDLYVDAMKPVELYFIRMAVTIRYNVTRGV